MVPMQELEYTGIMEKLEKLEVLEKKFAVREERKKAA